MQRSNSKPLGRRPGNRAAKDDILTSARALFSTNGWEATSIRAVARDAAVDPGLVLHYFGDKAQLFRTAMSLPLDPDDAVARIVPGPRGCIGRRLVAFFLSFWDDPVRREPLTRLLRAAPTSEPGAELLRQALTQGVLGPVGEYLGGEDRALRVGLCSSELTGLGMARY